MKAFALILVYFVTFWALYLIFSCAGLIWTSWQAILDDKGWFGAYCLFLGWWMAAIVTHEVYEKLYEDK